ncbi:MAG: hypothetical protein COA38_02180 [Fluviicola sp.]|nr:MAG: hypothetical protein COA38_02180 [Fluviicola sp.]
MIVSIIVGSFASAQSDTVADRKFSVVELRTDLSFWRNRLETKHPLIYLYQSKAEVDNYFDSLNWAIEQPMTEIEFFNHIAPVSSFLRDGHNTILPSDVSLNAMRKTKMLLPLDLKYFGEHLYVLRNLSANLTIKPGDEVSTINGVDVLEIKERLLRMVPQEGNNQQLAIGTINDLFRFYYQIVYGFPDHNELTIQYPDASEKQFSLESRNLKEIRAIRTLRYPKLPPRKPRGIYFEELEDGKNAILTISTFDQETLKHSKQRFRSEIRGIFRQLKKSKTENLILDLRDNPGGNPDFVKVVLKHLFDHRFEQAKEFRIVQRAGAENFNLRTRKKWYPWFGIGKFSPAHNHFDGKIVVLHDANTFSAGVEVLSVLRKYDRATFIGSESGGNPVIMGGFISKTQWELPNTKLQFSSGTHCRLFEDLEKNTGRGIIPDIEVVPDLFDTLTGYDSCLEYALEMIGQGEKSLPTPH